MVILYIQDTDIGGDINDSVGYIRGISGGMVFCDNDAICISFFDNR